MMELIVLGEIPGTGFQLTLSWVIAIATLMVGITMLRHTHKHHDTMQHVDIEEKAL